MTIRRCFQCETVNPPEQSFCGHCGAALVLKDYIAAQVNKGIAESPRDREALIKTDAVEVFEKAWGWAKLTAEIMLIPVLAVVTLLGWLGWREFNLSKAAANAQQQIETTSNTAKVDINRAATTSIAEVNTTSGKAVEANRQSADAAARASRDVTSTVTKTKAELRSEAASVRDDVAKSRTELESVHKLQPEFDTMRSQLTKATSDLAAQQKVISSSEEFVKQVFSTHITYMFAFKDFVQPNAVVIPAPQGVKNSIVMMLVPDTPIQGTLQLQYKIFMQPPGSYFQIHNLIIFFWGDPPQNLKTDGLAVSFDLLPENSTS